MGQTLFGEQHKRNRRWFLGAALSTSESPFNSSCLREKILTCHRLFLCLIFVALLILIWKNQQQQQKRLLENGCKSDFFASNCIL